MSVIERVTTPDLSLRLNLVEDDNHALIQQVVQLKGLLKESRKKELELQRQLETHSHSTVISTEDTSRLQVALAESRSKVQELEQAIQQLHSRLHAKELEFENIQRQFQATQASLALVNQQLEDVKRDSEKSSSRLEGKEEELQHQLTDLEQQCLSHQLAFEEVKLHKVKQEEKAKNLEMTLSTKASELIQALSQRDENEARLKVAQQHLAKKVRETSLLSERVEELEAHVERLKTDSEQLRSKSQEGQLKADWAGQQVKKLEEQLNDAHRFMEDRDQKWETKYYQTYEKWQESEWRLRELESLEERYAQLQALFTNASTLLGTPLPHRTTAAPRHPTRTPQPETVKMREEVNTLPPPPRMRPEFFEDGAP